MDGTCFEDLEVWLALAPLGVWFCLVCQVGHSPCSTHDTCTCHRHLAGPGRCLCVRTRTAAPRPSAKTGIHRGSQTRHFHFLAFCHCSPFGKRLGHSQALPFSTPLCFIKRPGWLCVPTEARASCCRFISDCSGSPLSLWPPDRHLAFGRVQTYSISISGGL